MGKYSMATYREVYKQGPFPHRIDPWSEAPHYFQQIHSEMISHILTQIQDRLFDMGYYAGREASLQIAENREPDIFIQRTMNASQPQLRWDYVLAAEEVLADAGTVIESEVTLEAIHIYKEGGELVTVVEIISPGNKLIAESISDYRQRRERLVLEKGVNVVEIDPTRSIKRMVSHPAVSRHPYHAVVYLPGESPHLIDMAYAQPMKRIALPLRGQVVATDLQMAYNHAYQLVAASTQMLNNGFYTEDIFPFPSLLTDTQIREALETVTRWREELKRLQTSSS